MNGNDDPDGAQPIRRPDVPASQPTQPQVPLPYQPPPYQQAWPPPAMPASRPGPGLAVASLVLGLLGLFLSWFTFGIPSLFAVVLGAIAIRRANVGAGSRAMGVAGLVLGLIPVVILGGLGVLLGAGLIASS
jgi:hypothetical protein